MTDRERIEYLMNIYKLTPSQFADRTGIQRASVSHILADRNKASLEVFLKIHRSFPDVPLDWLVADEGEPPTADNISEDTESDSEASEDESVEDSPVIPSTATTLFPSFMEEVAAPIQEPRSAGGNSERKNGQITKSVLSASSEISASPVTESIEVNTSAMPEEQHVEEPVALKVASDGCKRVREIKIFYDNGTYETFVPEK